jgi:hypothetical protein
VTETRIAAAGDGLPLRGRAAECGVLGGLLADVRRGESRSLQCVASLGSGRQRCWSI